jgi:hypothetical protein
MATYTRTVGIAKTRLIRTVSFLCLAGLTAAALMTYAAPAAHAQAAATPDPPTLNQQLRDQLALGDPNGCLALLRVPAPDPGDEVDILAADKALDTLGAQIGNELAAICGSSAVTSASSLGGGLNTLQATKTVSQFRLVRRRIDQRLQRQRPKPPSGSRRTFLQAQPSSPTLAYADAPFEASGLFGEVEYEQRDRIDTAYESGYESRVRGLSVGLDHMFATTVVGGWVSFTDLDADLTRSGGVFTAGSDDPEFRRLVNDPSVLASVCGGLPPAGALRQNATRFGGFVGRVFGRGGFVDANVSWSRRSHDYSRGVCAIENQGDAAFAPDTVFNDANEDGNVDAGELQTAVGRGVLFSDSNQDPARRTLEIGTRVFDDIFAGALTGSTRLREAGFSVRTGGDFGAAGWTIGPRAILSYARARTDAFTETGRSTVANPVISNTPRVVRRTLGGPTGLELAYDEASRYSLLLELGGEVSHRFGTRVAIAPLAAAYWRHEFNDVRDIVNVHMAQDLRSAPWQFSFGTDAPDPNTATVALGASALVGTRFAARVEWRRLLLDDLFDATGISVQARLRF